MAEASGERVAEAFAGAGETAFEGLFRKLAA
jgi:hypothetical protein